MKIVVIVRQAPAPNLPIEYDRWLGGVDPDDIVYTTSPGDLQAVEEAIRIRDSQGQGTVTLVAIAPAHVETVLQHYLSMGADEAVNICDRHLENSDAYGLALALYRAIRKMKYDLILCGSESVDDCGCSVFLGPYLAEMLGLPHLSGVTKIEVPAGSREVIVQQKMERGDRGILRSPLPCLLAVEEGINEPRYATFPDSLNSLRKDIQVLDLASLGLRAEELGRSGSLTQVVSFSLPRGRVKKGLVIDTKLSAAERMKIVRSGGLSSRSNRRLLSGEPKELVEEIAAILKSQGIIS